MDHLLFFHSREEGFITSSSKNQSILKQKWEINTILALKNKLKKAFNFSVLYEELFAFSEVVNLFRVFKDQCGSDFVKRICHSTYFLMDFFSFPSADKPNALQEGRWRKFLMSLILFFIILPVKLIAFYIRYLLFSSYCQVFANDVLLFESLVVCALKTCARPWFFSLLAESFPVIKFCRP